MTSYPTYPAEPQPPAGQSQVPHPRVPPDQQTVPPAQSAVPHTRAPEAAHGQDPLPAGPVPAGARPPGGWPAAHVPARSVPRDRHHEEPGYRAPGMEHDPATVYWPPASEDDRMWAMIAYLGMVFFAFLPPLAAYLLRHRDSPFVRYHAVQALNLWVTLFLYSVSFLIIGGVMAADTVSAALAIAVPLMAAAAILMLVFVVLSALAAARGETYRIPAWLCAPLLK